MSTLLLYLYPTMTYAETINYLYTRLPMFSRVGASAIKKDLTNTIALCQALGNPQKAFRSVHIAGTNGKGSTSHMLAAILQTAGYKTGLYTSPHLHDFRERIRINGMMVPESYVVEFANRIKFLIESIEPSFFEVTVAMAFSFFADEQVDIAVVEVGLGGRLDSTNIVSPEVSIVTNIGWDHTNLLGNTLVEIAGEKAGIIKHNVPVVVGESAGETKDVFINKAKETESPIVFADHVRYIDDWKHEKNSASAEVVEVRGNVKNNYVLDLPGIYQSKNLVTVLAGVDALRKKGWDISDAVVKEALQKVRKLTGLHGRWELIRQEPTVVLDVAHNEDGMRQVIEQLELSDFHHLHIVIGMVKDKEIEKVLAVLPKHAQYYFTRAGIPRALPEDELATRARQQGLKGESFVNVGQALDKALFNAQPEDLILVCGSVFVVGEVEREAVRKNRVQL